jgi:O-methyltransferase
MRFPTYSTAVRERIDVIPDDVRYAFLALAIQRLKNENIDGAFAELGVYRGFTSKFMHQQAPDRRLYLFDTFEGFPAELSEASGDDRFRDTSQESVARYIGGTENVLFRVGYFPATAAGLENIRFALVMLDCDLYESAVQGLRFFYPRLVPGGYFFLHDFNSTESNHAIERAVSEFMADKPEMPMEIPDEWGSAVFRKSRSLSA